VFKKILFATSASPCCDAAARVAFDLAGRYSAELVTFHVLGVPSRGYSQLVTDVRTGDEVECDEDYTQWVLEELRTTYENQLAVCPECRLETKTGVPYREVLRKAREVDADLIIMGASTTACEIPESHRRDVAGSTLQAVAKSSRCPVLVVNRPAASFWGGFSNIVFATDFSKASDSAFQFGLKTAREMGCTMHMFHALDITGVHAGKSPDQDTIEDRVLAARKKIREKYVWQMDGFKDYEIDVWEGIPYVEIVKFAREKQADLIVMAHHTHEIDPEKAVFGSTLEQVLLRATCPVASVNRPDKI
jgi:nucleotide-binding universal stress UspA family protein